VWPLGLREVAAVKDGMVEAKSVEVLEPRVRACDFRLAGRPVTFVGTVRARATGLPVPKAQIAAHETWTRWLERGAWNTDETGTFRGGPGPREPVAFEVTAVGFSRASLEVAPDEGGEETRFFLDLDEEGRLLGRVVDRLGAGLLGAHIDVQRPGRILYSAQTDVDGSFSLGMLPAGESLRVSVRPPEVGWTSRTLEVTLERPGEVRDLGTIVLVPK
ncbi:MAG: carboxypeptidase-like regulatory domain-containing protein, partial [Planctomycetota bacterium]